MDPYRNDLQTKVNSLEERIGKLEKNNSNRDKGLVLSAARKSLARSFQDGSAWLSLFISGLMGLGIIMAPAYLSSCQDSPEELRAREEAETAKSERLETSCQSMQMHFIGYNEHYEKLTCGNESNIVIIDLSDGDIETQSLSPTNSN